MPTLNWIGKEAVVNHDKEVPFKLLKKVKSASVGDSSQNLIVHGDNLEALKALMPFYGGKIKCIYIDPPYNTGNEGWIYNDKVNSPKIKKWLGKVVGAESQDLNRHDKWLCMMYPRLKLLKDLLTNDGIIFISIADNEVHHLRILLDEIFNETNFVAQLGWQKVYGPKNQSTYFSNDYEFVLCYSKDISNIEINLLPRSDEMNARYKNPDNDPRGDWKPGDLVANEERKNGHFVIKSPKTGKEFNAPSGKHWSYSQQNLEQFVKDNRVWFGKDGNAFPSIKQFLNEVKQGRKASSLLLYKDYGHTDEAKKDIIEIFPEQEKVAFDTPKPIRLIKNLIRLGSNSQDIILDSFAGSGTTGHAVLDLNKEDSGNRKFILVEMEDTVAKDITAERVSRAIKKYGYNAGFEYCELGKPLFNEQGQIDEECEFNHLATYIYFTETKTNIDPKEITNNFIGQFGETEYYLLYKEKGNNILDKSFLKKLKKDSGQKVVYADKCMIDDKTLSQYNLIFKQIPYEVRVY